MKRAKGLPVAIMPSLYLHYVFRVFFTDSLLKKKLDRRLRRELIFSKYDSFLFSVPVPFVRKFSP